MCIGRYDNAASLAKLNYSVADFSDINCTNIINLSQTKTDKVAVKLSGNSSIALYNNSAMQTVSSDFYKVDLESFNQILLLELSETGKDKVLAAVKLLEQRTDVLYAGPNHLYSFANNVSTAEMEDMNCLTSNVMRSVSTNDTYASEQWAIDQISLPSAWGITTGTSKKVTVGIIDDGIDATHADLEYKVSISKSRLINYQGSVSTTNTVNDRNGHGTLIAGIIGAQTNNSFGISGVNWNIELVSLSMADVTSEAAICAALNQAETLQIPIVNLSIAMIGSDTLFANADDLYSGLLICAAGNMTNAQNTSSTSLLPHYPVYHDWENIISVGASTQFDTPWVNSYHGSMVDLFAPGAAVYSTMSESVCNEQSCDVDPELLPYDHHVTCGYHAVSGTSFAAPYVVGVASLLLSMDDDMSTAQLKYHIINGVDISSAYQGKCQTGGRLNAYKVLSGHSLTYFYTDDGASGHYSYCACGHYELKDHNFSVIGGLSVCSDCGFAW